MLAGVTSNRHVVTDLCNTQVFGRGIMVEVMKQTGTTQTCSDWLEMSVDIGPLLGSSEQHVIKLVI